MSFSVHSWLAKAGFSLLAVLVAGVIPAEAGGIGFRNDLAIPVYVQGYSIVGGMRRLSPPILIEPGKTAWDNKLPPDTRFVSVYYGQQPTQALIRDVSIPFRGFDLFYSIRSVGGKVILTQEKLPPP